MRKYILAASLAVAALTSGCATQRDTNTLTGAVVGGAIGNVLGHGSAGATVGGAVVGGVIGNSINSNERRYYDNRSNAQRRYDECRARGYSDWDCRR